MRPGEIVGSATGWLLRSYRGLSLLRRVALGLVTLAAIASGLIAYQWWTAWTPRLALHSEGGNYPMAFSSDGSTLATSSAADGIILWDPKDGRRKAEWPNPDGRRWTTGKFSPDGRTLAVTWWKTESPGVLKIDLIDVASGKVRATVVPPLPSIQGLASVAEGQTLRVFAGEKRSRVFVDVDVATGLVGPIRPISCALPWGVTALSNDGRVMAVVDRRPTATGPESVVVWDLDRDRQVAAIPAAGASGEISAIALDSGGKSLAIGHSERPVEVWDVATAKLRSELEIHGSAYRSWMLHFSPDGSKLASMGLFHQSGVSLQWLQFLHRRFAGDRYPILADLVVVDLATGRELGRSSTEGMAVVFSRDGRTLAASHEDLETRVHDLPGGP